MHGQRIRLYLVLALGWIATSSAALAQTQTETQKLLPVDVGVNDAFGRNVAVGGSRAVIGALFDDDQGSNAGAAYVFDAGTGQLLQKVFASDPPGSEPASEDTYGSWGAIDAGRILVGAPRKEEDGVQSGAAYLIDATTLGPIRRLLPFSLDPNFSSAGGAFGWSVDLTSAYLLVGAPGDLDFSNFGGGAAYLYRNDFNQTLIAKFSSNDVGPGDNFGRRVALADGVAVVGVPFDDDNGTDAGAIYRFDPETAQQLEKLVADDGASGDLFGIGLAASGNRIAVGASEHDGVADNAGAVYLFDATTGQQLRKVVPTDASEGARFGRAVAIDGDRLIVGAPFDQGNGAAYVFDVWTGDQLIKLVASDAEAGDGFGSSVAISGATVIVGAEGDDDNGDLSGSAYRFVLQPVPVPATSELTVFLLTSALLLGLSRFIHRACTAA